MHICQDCGCDVFTMTESGGYKIPECMGCGSIKPPIKSGINSADPPPADRRWNPDKAKDDLKYKEIRHWENLRKEWLNEWNKRVGYRPNRSKRS